MPVRQPALALLACSGLLAGAAATRVSWSDTAPVRALLERHDITEERFASRLDAIAAANRRRVREGDLDHLVFYILQSTRFTRLPPIEPARSAQALVDALAEPDRRRFLETDALQTARVPPDARARMAAFAATVTEPSSDPRLAWFRSLVRDEIAGAGGRQAALEREYLRAMRFLYLKEFVARESAQPRDEVAALYRTRGLSTDTAVEAGYTVAIGLGVVKGLEPAFRVSRALVVGPGLDLAPRSGLSEAGPPESYQPWAVMDALVGLDLAGLGALEVVAADINPRVVSHLRRARDNPPVLSLAAAIGDPAVSLTPDYREYLGRLGGSIGAAAPGGAGRTIRVGPAASRALHAALLDITTSRLDGQPFDLIVATNILPYFDDVELALALVNVAAMLRPGGFFLHNEPRPLVGDVTEAVGLRFLQSRHATIATVAGAKAPLFDAVFIHKKG